MQHQKPIAEYRKRNLIFWGLLLGYIPAVLIIGIPLGQLLKFKEIPGLLALIWMLSFAVASGLASDVEVPRCHNRFYYKWWYHNSFATKCVHCRFRPSNPQ